MAESFSAVTLVGTLRRFVELQTLPTGVPYGAFELILKGQTATGMWYSNVIPCQIWGKGVEAARALRPGQPCIFQGKLAQRRRGEHWEMIVSGYELLPLTLPAAVAADEAAARHN